MCVIIILALNFEPSDEAKLEQLRPFQGSQYNTKRSHGYIWIFYTWLDVMRHFLFLLHCLVWIDFFLSYSPCETCPYTGCLHDATWTFCIQIQCSSTEHQGYLLHEHLWNVTWYAKKLWAYCDLGIVDVCTEWEGNTSNGCWPNVLKMHFIFLLLFVSFGRSFFD